jgi:hypothetical protein
MVRAEVAATEESRLCRWERRRRCGCASGAGGAIFGKVGQWAAAGAVGGAAGSLRKHCYRDCFDLNLRSHRISNSLTAALAKKGTSWLVGNSGGRNRTQLRPWKLKLNPTRSDDWEFSYHCRYQREFLHVPILREKDALSIKALLPGC